MDTKDGLESSNEQIQTIIEERFPQEMVDTFFLDLSN